MCTYVATMLCSLAMWETNNPPQNTYRNIEKRFCFQICSNIDMAAVEPVVTDQPDEGDAPEVAINGSPVTVPTTGTWGSKLTDCWKDKSSCKE